MSGKTLDARTAAALTTHAVIFDKRSLNDVMQHPDFTVASDDLGLWRELSFGVIRWYWPLAAHTDSLLRQPLKERDKDVYCLLLVGMYQLMHLRTAQHAAVNETVNSVIKLKKKWARSLVNALLRQTVRQLPKASNATQATSEDTSAIDSTALPDDNAVRELSHPLWLLTHLQRAWPEQWVAIAKANNARPSMTLRVNQQKISREAYQLQLQSHGIDARVHEDLPHALALPVSIAVSELPGHDQGLVSVQDGGAQRAAMLLQAQPNDRVLDACAAPGGKSCYLLESAPDIELVALDVSAARLARVEDSLQRLDLKATLTAADARDTKSWWDGRLFNRILIDAPCSGTGVISRHPDIKHLRRESDLAANAERQLELLQALWPLLAPAGRLVYATCSLQPEENENVINHFLKDSASVGGSATVVSVDIPGTVARAPGYQCLPTADGQDGFFYAVLERTATPEPS